MIRIAELEVQRCIQSHPCCGLQHSIVITGKVFAPEQAFSPDESEDNDQYGGGTHALDIDPRLEREGYQYCTKHRSHCRINVSEPQIHQQTAYDAYTQRDDSLVPKLIRRENSCSTAD